MLSAVPVNDIGIWFAIGTAGLAGYFAVKARSGNSSDDEAVKTATLASTQIAALESKVGLLESDKRNLETEIRHLHELRSEDAKTAERNAERNATDIQRLTEMVTQQLLRLPSSASRRLPGFEAMRASPSTPSRLSSPDHVPSLDYAVCPDQKEPQWH